MSVKEAAELVFETHGIVQQQYHTRTLIGNHCKRLLNDHKEILSEIDAVFKSRQLRRENIEDNVDEKIDSFISLMTKILAKAHSIFRIMARIEHQHSDEECNDFELLVEQFGVLWRSPEFYQPAPCKFHGVEGPSATEKSCRFMRRERGRISPRRQSCK